MCVFSLRDIEPLPLQIGGQRGSRTLAKRLSGAQATVTSHDQSFPRSHLFLFAPFEARYQP